MEAQKTLEPELRHVILLREVVKYRERGYSVVSETDYSAVFCKRKKMNLNWLTFWVFLGFGIGLLGYLVYFIAKKEEVFCIDVLLNGEVLRTPEIATEQRAR